MMKEDKNCFVGRGFYSVVLLFFFSFVFVYLLPLGSATTLTACQTLSSSGYYDLSQSITANATCFTVTADNVEIDCKGYRISYGINGANTGIGVDATDGSNTHTNLTVRNCIITKPMLNGTTGYGIRLTRFSSSFIVNNTIKTNGSSSNYGMLLTTNSQSNLVENNSINSFGVTTTNIGLYLLSGTSGNIVRGNVIMTNGSASDYGIMISTASDNNVVVNNTVFTASNATTGNTDNWGVYVVTADSNNITDNNINTNGIARSWGFYLVTNADSNRITSNNITTTGAGATNYGIYLATGASNVIANNTIMTNGTTGNYGIYLATTSDNNAILNNTVFSKGTTTNNWGVYITQSSTNNITDNVIVTNGTTGNYGIYLLTNANSNIIQSNNITAGGTTTNYGMFLSTASYNKIYANNITASGITKTGTTNNWGVYLVTNSITNDIANNSIWTHGGATNIGLYFLTDSNNNNATGNNITTNGGSTTNYGALVSASTSNMINFNTIWANGSTTNYGVYLFSSAQHNVVADNNITTNGTTSHALYFAVSGTSYPNFNNLSRNIVGWLNPTSVDFSLGSASINNTFLINQQVRNYSLTAVGGLVYVRNESFGEIRFLKPLNGSGINFSDYIKISNNFVLINASAQKDFNKSAQITLYNFSTTLTKLSIYRDGVLCPAAVCQNLTWMQNGNITFNVTGWSNYSIFSTDPLPPLVTLNLPNNVFNTSQQNLTFNFTATDETSLNVSCDLFVNSTLSVTNGTVLNNTLTNIQTTNLGQGNHSWYIRCFDSGNNTNTTAVRLFNVDISPASMSSITYWPTSRDIVDPGSTLFFNATLTDNLAGISSAFLQYYNGSAWLNRTMSLAGSNVYQGNLTLEPTEVNYTFNVWTNDSVGNANLSTNSTFSSLWDCTWFVNSDIGQTAGWDQNKLIGNITINNTGDAPFSNGNCSLSFRVSHNLDVGRIYFNNWALNQIYTYYDVSSLSANTSTTFPVNATFKNTVSQESVIITTSDVLSRSSNSSGNTTATLVSNQNGPYLYNLISTAPSSAYLSPINISLEGYIRNLMGSSTINVSNTAFNVSFYWVLPSILTNVSGNITANYSNITDNSLNYNDLNVTFESLASLSPGATTVYLYAYGYNSSGSMIVDANGRSLLNESVNITLSCYNNSDGVYVTACGASDGDYVASSASTASSSSGGGGGGGGERTTTRQGESSANFELVTGNIESFEFKIDNSFDGEMKDIKISVSGINSRYIDITPSSIESIAPKSSYTAKIRINAPAYFREGKYELSFSITAVLFEKNKTENYNERRKVTLYVLELSREKAEKMFKDAETWLKEMSDLGLEIKDISLLFESLKKYYEKITFSEVGKNYDLIKEIYTAATESYKIINELTEGIKESERNGISVSGTKRLLYVAEVAFKRGDYVLALERLKEAKLTYALETKGEFNLLFAVKNNPLESLGILFAAAILSTGSTLVIKSRIYKRKLKMLGEEEKLLLELMRVVQRECFEKNKLSMEEYQQAMMQYEEKLGKAIEDRIRIESKLLHVFKLKGKKNALGEEKKRLIEMVMKVQDSYLRQGKMETRIYENMMKTYSSRLAEVEEEVTFLDAKEQLAENSKLSRIFRFWRKKSNG